MSKITSMPTKPSRRRRMAADWYEFVAFVFFILSIIGFMIVLLMPTDQSGIDPANRIMGLQAIAGVFFASGIFIFLFDRSAVRRANAAYEFDLKEYEILRKAFLENEKIRMESGIAKDGFAQVRLTKKSVEELATTIEKRLLKSPAPVYQSSPLSNEGQSTVVIDNKPLESKEIVDISS